MNDQLKTQGQKEKPSSQENALGTAPIGRLLFSLAVPAITAQVVNMLYNIVDRIYIGHIPEIGTAALTGVGITFPIITLISAFSSLVAMGGAPRASIAMGAHHKERAERILRQQRREKRLKKWGYSTKEFDQIMEEHLRSKSQIKKPGLRDRWKK